MRLKHTHGPLKIICVAGKVGYVHTSIFAAGTYRAWKDDEWTRCKMWTQSCWLRVCRKHAPPPSQCKSTLRVTTEGVWPKESLWEGGTYMRVKPLKVSAATPTKSSTVTISQKCIWFLALNHYLDPAVSAHWSLDTRGGGRDGRRKVQQKRFDIKIATSSALFLKFRGEAAEKSFFKHTPNTHILHSCCPAKHV